MKALTYLSDNASRLGRLATLAGRVLFRSGPTGLFRRVVNRHNYRIAQRQVDAEYGTETLSSVAIDDLLASGPNVAHAYEYHPSPAFYADAALRSLPVDASGYVFADLGCGKGLVLILASKFGFSRIVGVEFGRSLYETAVVNLDKFRQRHPEAPPIDVLLADAAEFPLPTEPLVLYLYNPFGPEVIRKVLANLQLSLSEHPRQCWVVYVNPLHHQLFIDSDFLGIYLDRTHPESGEPHAIYTNRTITKN